MKRVIFLLMCFFSYLNGSLRANEELLNLFHLAVENGDLKLVNEVIDALSKNKNLLDALAKYSENGKIDCALINAINDNNLIASIILTYHSKNVHTVKHETEFVKTKAGNRFIRGSKTPLFLSLDKDMLDLTHIF